MSMMERANAPRVPASPALSTSPEIAVRPKRQYKRRSSKGDA
jgi:hypothetical protein